MSLSFCRKTIAVNWSNQYLCEELQYLKDCKLFFCIWKQTGITNKFTMSFKIKLMHLKEINVHYYQQWTNKSVFTSLRPQDRGDQVPSIKSRSPSMKYGWFYYTFNRCKVSPYINCLPSGTTMNLIMVWSDFTQSFLLTKQNNYSQLSNFIYNIPKSLFTFAGTFKN